jgi:ribosome recycling factor
MNFNTSKEIITETMHRMNKALESAKKEFQTLRTGRASVNLVEDIRVSYYGTLTPIKQLSAITTPDPKTILIQPWDHTALKEIEAAIIKAEIGLTPNNDGKIIRIGVPPLTQERRDEMTKLVKKMAEEGRISVRNSRREANEVLKKIQKEAKITEDDLRKSEAETQKLTDKYIKFIDEALAQKEQEIHTV